MVFCRKSIELSPRATDLAMGSVFYNLASILLSIHRQNTKFLDWIVFDPYPKSIPDIFPYKFHYSKSMQRHVTMLYYVK